MRVCGTVRETSYSNGIVKNAAPQQSRGIRVLMLVTIPILRMQDASKGSTEAGRRKQGFWKTAASKDRCDPTGSHNQKRQEGILQLDLDNRKQSKWRGRGRFPRWQLLHCGLTCLCQLLNNTPRADASHQCGRGGCAERFPSKDMDSTLLIDSLFNITSTRLLLSWRPPWVLLNPNRLKPILKLDIGAQGGGPCRKPDAQHSRGGLPTFTHTSIMEERIIRV